MPTPFHKRQPGQTDGAQTIPRTTTPEFRCTYCEKLLGVRMDDRMHLRFARGHEYIVGFPVQATCRSCRTLNHATSPAL